MSQKFTFSDPGEGLHEAEILEVNVSSGDSVSDGDTVLTLETDKSSVEVPAPFTGTVDEINVNEGDTVSVGDVLMTYTAEGQSNEASDDDESSGKSEPEEQDQEEQTEQKSDTDDSGQADETQRTSEDDEGETEEPEDKQDKRTSSRAGEPVPAAPSTRRRARELGVDLHEVEPSGPQGRVTTEDVEAHGEKSEASRPQSQSASEGSPLTPGLAPTELPDFSQWGEIERTPLRSIRRATAENMARSWSQIPHVYHQDTADITELERFRRKHQGEHGKLTVTVLAMKALAGLLQRYPRFNASLDVGSEEIVLKHYCHIGLAVATDQGLLVPVIRNVDRKSLLTLADEVDTAAQQARDGELGPGDMQGASMTITNVGPLGGSSLTPLINHPQAAILGMAQARLTPVVAGDIDDYHIVARQQLPLVLGFDHRINDGADAAGFMTELTRALANPESLLLAV